MFDYIRRLTSLKLTELEILILEFSRQNHTIDEINNFRATLLENAYYKIVKKYICTETDKLIKKAKNGIYIAPPILYVEVVGLDFKKHSPSTMNMLNSENYYVKSCNFYDFTIAQFCEIIEIKFSFLKQLVGKHNLGIAVKEDLKISDEIWSYIEEFSKQKITLILRRLKYNPKDQQKTFVANREIKKREYDRKISRRGSIYKILYTGMID